MKKNTVKKLITAIGVTALMLGSLTGCGSTEAAAETTEVVEETVTEDAAAEVAEVEETVEETVEEENVDLNGTITMAGSTSMEKFANALAESFMAKYPGVTVTAEFTGSSAGVESVLAGSVDIGNSSRNLKEEEIANGAVENIVAIDGIAVVTDAANTVTGLTKDQLIGIYTGEIKNWSELGGEDLAIVVVGREAGSGTRDGFESITDTEDACKYRQELTSTGDVITTVAQNPSAIGYASVASVKDTVKAVTVDGVAATGANIKDGSYVVQRPFVLVTKSDTPLGESAQNFFDYITSAAANDIISAAGVVPAN